MRRYFALFLILLLLLTGCTNKAIDPDATVASTEPTGYYEANSPIEDGTAGAVRQYAIPDGNYRWVKNIGDRLLLATDESTAQMLVLSGADCIPVAQNQLPAEVLEKCETLFNGFAYYDATANAWQMLDPQLQQVQSIAMPSGITNTAISQSGDQIFYTLGKEIRSYDISRKISRLVKTVSVDNYQLLGACFGGKLLVCEIENADGKKDTIYVSSESGQTLITDNNILALHTYENGYLAERMDGIVHQIVVGLLDGEAKQLNIADEHVVGALELGGAIGYTVAENELALNFYDLSAGNRTSSVTIQSNILPKTVLADKWSGCVWILASNVDGKMLLLRWDTKSSAIADDATYVGALYTAQNPDTDAMKMLEDRASALNKKYGVRIRIWQEAVKTPGNHVLVPEHQISAITDLMDKLEKVLAEFPKGFISKSLSSKVRICLVRSVDGEAKGVQYWTGSNAFIALSTGTDVRSEFLKAFGCVIDSHVLGNSPKYDYWDGLNPSGFLYGGVVDESLISGENRAFVDVDSMASSTADRSRVFWQAMQPENAEVFQSETMQAKLKMLCKAIRDAWGLERKTDVYPWEQYLTKPIAYKKK